MTFWNWGPTTIWYNIESVAFLFSKSLHPTLQHSRQAAQHGWWDHRESTLEGSSAVHSCLCGLVLTGVYLIKFSNPNLLYSPCSKPSHIVLLLDVMYKMYARVGRFCTFSNFMQRHVVYGSPRYNMGTYPIFFILVQKPVRGLKVHIFNKKTKRQNFLKV